ncbi:glycerol-3-phosphate 1-O-acyltransferase PlsY [Pradoshia sp. D12]|uniref:glycerol-3-phosphate 1-O-acyltransferase PlsY n=1 Tax=Bacillaceae TaxID=186817 RepID=UPI00080AE1CB|nr:MULTISPECIES: glycerol-3-phosphate 1-O-acyltransferase PlsY [Bacillaceae]OCA86872.1 glycerol-3-phosphate acyltransferase [Bacillus sp. FJAT-27986]QFK71356.1 glycerol-3-phosphate 1-O-acyltransferase PlsY [Pradoshia sp. D12]TPF73151.1 glycerol-3-phosphate 1-O-acyltransferase PlsY [Bacillus sp. D12]
MLYFLFILAYLLGSIPSGLIIGKVFYNTDIREHGSGNLGGTNTFRTLGKKAGIIVTTIDILKGTLATLLPYIFNIQADQWPSWIAIPLICGLLAVIGHMYPIFAGFRGGKAVATSGGILLGYDPLLFVILVACFFVFLYLTKIVSLSSMLIAVVALIYAMFSGDPSMLILIIFLAGFIFYRHRANIKRIINKTEPKVNLFKR